MADPGPSTSDIDAAPAEVEPTDDVTIASEMISDVRANVEAVIVGNTRTIEHTLTAMLARGHVLLEDAPGVGKTMLARTIARSFEGEFSRIQFTPDLLPSDVTGTNVYNRKRNEFEFRPGPVFANLVLGDEINRAPPKTQSALLEAMEEEQVTVDGDTRPLPKPFTIIATQNAVGTEGAYELPLAELDRFTKKLQLGYPEKAEESEMLGRMSGSHPIETLEPVATLGELRHARAITAELPVVERIRTYIIEIARYTRDKARVGLSPRGSMQLLRAAQARAVLEGRDYVVPNDVKTEALAVVAHRIRIGGDRSPDALVRDALSSIDPE